MFYIGIYPKGGWLSCMQVIFYSGTYDISLTYPLDYTYLRFVHINNTTILCEEWSHMTLCYIQ